MVLLVSIVSDYLEVVSVLNENEPNVRLGSEREVLVGIVFTITALRSVDVDSSEVKEVSGLDCIADENGTKRGIN